MAPAGFGLSTVRAAFAASAAGSVCASAAHRQIDPPLGGSASAYRDNP